MFEGIFHLYILLYLFKLDLLTQIQILRSVLHIAEQATVKTRSLINFL